jgi:hypothetical protein
MIKASLSLNCDGCPAFFLFDLEVEGMPDEDHAKNLRRLAHEAGWIHFELKGVPDSRDLCSKCAPVPHEVKP